MEENVFPKIIRSIRLSCKIKQVPSTMYITSFVSIRWQRTFSFPTFDLNYLTFNQKHKSVKNALRVLWHVQDSSDGWSYESKLVSKEVVLVNLVLKHFSVKSIVDQQSTNLINLEHFLGEKKSFSSLFSKEHYGPLHYEQPY